MLLTKAGGPEGCIHARFFTHAYPPTLSQTLSHLVAVEAIDVHCQRVADHDGILRPDLKVSVAPDQLDPQDGGVLVPEVGAVAAAVANLSHTCERKFEKKGRPMKVNVWSFAF